MIFTEKHKFNEIKWNQHTNKYVQIIQIIWKVQDTVLSKRI